MKMTGIIIAVICGLLAGGGIFWSGVEVGQNTKASTNIQNSYQTTYVQQHTSQVQQAIQAQYTVLVPGVTNVIISLKDFTNLVKNTNWVISNFSASTNRR